MLILTKALGTGILTTAFKGGLVTDEELQPAIDSMRQLNRLAALAAKGLEIHACTDVTGFGLAGHLCEMAEGSNLTAVLDTAALPALPKALEMARMGLIPAGAYRNRDHFGSRTCFDGVALELADLAFDPQTSGGLLFALDERQAQTLREKLRDAGIICAVVGGMRAFDGVSVRAKK